MTEQLKAQVLAVAIYDGWVSTGLLHPFCPANGFTYKKKGFMGVTWIERFGYQHSFDWLIPVAKRLEEELDQKVAFDAHLDEQVVELWNSLNEGHTYRSIDMLFDTVVKAVEFLHPKEN